METHFAPAERATENDFIRDVQRITNNPLIDILMNTANGMFAVLNEQRQILALNDAFLKMIGIEDSATVLGLRPGEYVHCRHACEMPGGCGTSLYCSTCGAVVAILAALDTPQPQERFCAMTVERDNKEVDLFLQVRCCQKVINDHKLILMFIQDMTIEQQRAHLERTFLHDISNILTGVLGRSEMLKDKDDAHRQLNHSVRRLAQEISVEKQLLDSLSQRYKPFYSTSSANQILSDLRTTFVEHPTTMGRNLDISIPASDIPIWTDALLVNRVLTNMVCNALEAAEPGETVKVRSEPEAGSIVFSVWNRQAIPEDVARRIFQRNFSTKQTMGRGLGTFSMKFFGEQVLGGRVHFTTSTNEGTTFHLELLSQ